MTDREQFLADRRSGIGGSDAGAILGVSPFSTPLSVYQQKTGEADPPEETFAMRRGTALEPAILRMLSDDWGIEAVPGHTMRRHREHGHLIAHPDGWFVNADDVVEGIEAKSVGAYTTSPPAYWGDDADTLPPSYEAQCRHYMAVLDVDRWHVAALWHDDIRYYTVDRDHELEAAMIEKLNEFWWQHVIAGVPPEPQNADDARRLWPIATKGKIVTADAHEVEALKNLRAVRKQIKALKEREAGYLDILTFAMQDGEVMMLPGDPRPVFTYKTSTRKGYTVEPKTFRTARLTAHGEEAIVRRDAEEATA